MAAELAVALRLRGADAVYVSLSRFLGIPLVTRDAEQLARGGEVTSVVRPGE
jgi:predicted nucleic acid-binding protein